MACYSLYLWHYPAINTFQLTKDPWTSLNLAGYFLFLAALSALTYRCVEFRNVADWRSLFLINKPRRSIAAT